MTPVEIVDSLEKDLGQLQVNLQAHGQIQQIFRNMRQKIDASKNEELKKEKDK